jgi:hypothetical protein
MNRPAPFADSALFHMPGQAAACVVALAALAILYARRDELDRGLVLTGSDFGRYL